MVTFPVPYLHGQKLFLLVILTISSVRANAGMTKEEVMLFDGYKTLAEKGDANAQFHLGECYAYGDGVALDESKAFQWYGKAAQNGSALAQLNLSVFYENGHGVAKDLDQAIIWLKKSAEQGNPMARCNLAAHYSSGIGVEKDEVKAVTLFRIDADRGFALSQRNLAVAYFYGRGVERDLVESFAYLTLAGEVDATALRFRKVIESEWAKSNSPIYISSQIDFGKKRALQLKEKITGNTKGK